MISTLFCVIAVTKFGN
jgi:hypothetical protein